jgi:glycosyltransferase involved in cell wall biosynthesis
MERNVINQVIHGRRLGQDVAVLCLEREGVLADRARKLGAEVACVHKRPGVRIGVVWSIRKHLRRIRPHVIHTHQIGPLFYTGLAARGLGVPLIVHTEHGKVNYSGRRRTRWLGRLAARHASLFYCLTLDMADAVAAAGIVPPSRLRVIRNGIDTAFYQERRDPASVRAALGIPLDAPLIGTVGRLNEIKRQDVLLRAFARVVSGYVAHAHLVLVGDGPLQADLAVLAAQLRIEDRVHFTGYQADTRAHVQAMDVFALTSRSEGMPQALLEACVAQVPVVASRVGGIPEVIRQGETGMLVEVGDVDALATTLAALLADRAGATAMARRASEFVIARFDVARMAADYHGDFMDLLDRGAVVEQRTVPYAVAG